MSHLTIVPPATPDPKQESIQRVKAMKRPDGMVQCNRCGGRTVMSTWSGSTVKDGRYKAGTSIKEKVCYDCDRKGILSFMVPEPPKVVAPPAEPKPRRTKPKAVK